LPAILREKRLPNRRRLAHAEGYVCLCVMFLLGVVWASSRVYRRLFTIRFAPLYKQWLRVSRFHALIS
jgi:hypothetical protein